MILKFISEIKCLLIIKKKKKREIEEDYLWLKTILIYKTSF